MELAAEFGIYLCPQHQAPLAFARSDSPGPDGHASATREGALRCPKGHSFVVEGGLPRFVRDEGYAESFGFQWKLHHDTQLDSVNGSSLSRDRFFRATGWRERLEGEWILEAGCGSGRFTEILRSTGARVASFDYSRAADVTFSRFAKERVRVCQASIYEMPYRPASFDKVFCFGVLQHCPDVQAAFRCLVAMVKPGGQIAVDVYDRLKMYFNARYRVRWLTRRMDKKTLYRWCQLLVPWYLRLVPPLHPWNQLVVPIKDYRGFLPGLTRAQVTEWCVLDTFDALSPAFDQPQFSTTMRAWCQEAGLVHIEVQRTSQGVEVRAQKPLGQVASDLHSAISSRPVG